MSSDVADTAPLPPAERARGRRLAVLSHPFGMTFQMVFAQPLPTLALLSLGASETLVGVQSALVPAFLLLQLPTLRAVARLSKRTILIAAHVFALAAAAPLLALGRFPVLFDAAALPAALACFALVAAGISISNTVWFPLLRSYVEPERIGRFFGTLRTGWNLTLILFFLGSQRWLAEHPGAFGPLFGVAFALGVLRMGLIARLPERNERTGERIRVREALALAREPRMRRYLIGVAGARATQFTTVPFVMVLLRRELGFSDATLALASAAMFAGALVALYVSGQVVDRVGPEPVFRGTSFGMAALLLGLVLATAGGWAGTPVALAFFFGNAALMAAFGVADTHLLFRLTPEHAPSRALVLGSVAVGLAGALVPSLAGLALDLALDRAAAPLPVYWAFFSGLAGLQAAAFAPLRGLRDA